MARHVFQYDRWNPPIGLYISDPYALDPLEAMETSQRPRVRTMKHVVKFFFESFCSWPILQDLRGAMILGIQTQCRTRALQTESEHRKGSNQLLPAWYMLSPPPQPPCMMPLASPCNFRYRVSTEFLVSVVHSSYSVLFVNVIIINTVIP
jgi:hypothetical protein